MFECSYKDRGGFFENFHACKETAPIKNKHEQICVRNASREGVRGSFAITNLENMFKRMSEFWNVYVSPLRGWWILLLVDILNRV